jgi:hypothetical protein
VTLPAGCGVVFKLTPPAAGRTSWTQTVLHNFAGGTDGLLPVAGLVTDRAGNLYGTASAGGAGAGYCPGRSDGFAQIGCGVAYELIRPASGKSVWTEKVLFRFSGTNGAAPVGTLIMDAAGSLYGVTNGGGNPKQCPIGSSSAIDPGCGVVFKLKPPAPGKTVWTETVLHQFGAGTDGTHPYGGLVMDKAGNLYGTTSSGGGASAKCPANPTMGVPAGCGTAFKLSPPASAGGTWTETVIDRFRGQPHPAVPRGTLILGPDGSLYGTSFAGGAGNDPSAPTPGAGTVYKLSPVTGGSAWAELVLHSFGSDGVGPFAGVISDPAGNLYGTTYLSVGAAGAVFELSPPAAGGRAWSEKILYSFQPTQGMVPVGGLLRSKTGNLFGTTETGVPASGTNYSYGTVFKLSP